MIIGLRLFNFFLEWDLCVTLSGREEMQLILYTPVPLCKPVAVGLLLEASHRRRSLGATGAPAAQFGRLNARSQVCDQGTNRDSARLTY